MGSGRITASVAHKILDCSPNAVAIRDVDGNYLFVNRRMEEILELPGERIIGRNIREILGEKSIDTIFRRDREVLAKGRDLDFIETMDVGNGTKEFMVTRFPVTDDSGKPVAVCAVATELTHLRKLARDGARAESRSLQKDRYLASISHDIRTPLSGITALTNILLGMELPGDAREYLLMMKETAGTLVQLLTQILDYSKIEANRMELSSLRFEMRSVLSTLMGLFLVQAEEKGLEFSVSVAEGVPRFLRGDPNRLKQILINLIGNAIKFTLKGRVEVSVALSDETVDTVILEFGVTDTGPGIPKEKRKTIFESYSQLDNRDAGSGVGLGLAIARRLVMLMGGDLSVESTVGKGSCFRFTAGFGRELTEAPGIREEAAAVPADLPPLHILLAEDDRINSLYVSEILRRAGHRVTAVSNGQEAIDCLRRDGADLILMDGRMPVLDGIRTTRIIRSGGVSPETAGIPIIAFTAYASESDRKRFLDAGMNHYLCKPVTEDEIIAGITRVLSDKISETPVKDVATK